MYIVLYRSVTTATPLLAWTPWDNSWWRYRNLSTANDNNSRVSNSPFSTSLCSRNPLHRSLNSVPCFYIIFRSQTSKILNHCQLVKPKSFYCETWNELLRVNNSVETWLDEIAVVQQPNFIQNYISVSCKWSLCDLYDFSLSSRSKVYYAIYDNKRIKWKWTDILAFYLPGLSPCYRALLQPAVLQSGTLQWSRPGQDLDLKADCSIKVFSISSAHLASITEHDGLLENITHSYNTRRMRFDPV